MSVIPFYRRQTTKSQKSLAEAVAKVLPGKPETPWDQKGMTHNRVGDNVFSWLDGHAFEQAMPDHYLPDDVPKTSSGKKVWRETDLPIIPKEWVIFPKEAKQRRLDKLADLLKTCDVVHHLGDPDEEGQVLVDEALEYFGYTGPVKRVCVNDYNESKVKQSLAGSGNTKALELITRVSPAAWRHILLNGHYTFQSGGKMIDLDTLLAGLDLG